MVILGAKGHAGSIFLDVYKKYDEIKFFDNVSEDIGKALYGRYEILRTEEELRSYFRKDNKYVLGTGNPVLRYRLYKMAQKNGGQLVSTVSEDAVVGIFNNRFGVGSNIRSGVTITHDVKIGKGCLINVNCTVSHDSVLGDFVDVSPHTNILGHCTIGDFCLLGGSSVLLPNVTLGKNVTVGAGAVVTKDVPDDTLVVGVPAKKVKDLDPLDSYS